MDLWDIVPSEPDTITKELLDEETVALKTDRDGYLECMNGLLLRDRKTAREVRDGLILYHHIYKRTTRSTK